MSEHFHPGGDVGDLENLALDATKRITRFVYEEVEKRMASFYKASPDTRQRALVEAVEIMKARVKELEEALEYYEGDHWFSVTTNNGKLAHAIEEFPGGKRARQALRGGKEG